MRYKVTKNFEIIITFTVDTGTTFEIISIRKNLNNNLT